MVKLFSLAKHTRLVKKIFDLKFSHGSEQSTGGDFWWDGGGYLHLYL